MASMSQICITATGGTFQEAQEMRMCLMNMKERGGNTKISKEKLLPPHKIHCNHFPGRIYVDKTSE